MIEFIRPVELEVNARDDGVYLRLVTKQKKVYGISIDTAGAVFLTVALMEVHLPDCETCHADYLRKVRALISEVRSYEGCQH